MPTRQLNSLMGGKFKIYMWNQEIVLILEKSLGRKGNRQLSSLPKCKAMNVYHLLIVVFSIAFVAPCLRFLYVNYYFACIKWLMKVLMKAKRRIAARKSKLQAELEEIATKYGVPGSDLRV